MTEKDLILNFLNRQYCVLAGNHVFIIYDTINKAIYYIDGFIESVLEPIFNFNVGDGSIFDITFFEWCDKQEQELIKILTSYFKSCPLSSSLKMKTSALIYFKDSFETNFISLRFDDWYTENIMKNKVDEFLNQLTITHGISNWCVMWGDNGVISKEKIHNHFNGENDAQIRYVMQRYKSWYNAEIAKRAKTKKQYNFYNKWKA